MEDRQYGRSDDEDESRRRRKDLDKFLWTSNDPSGLPLLRESRSLSCSNRSSASRSRSSSCSPGRARDIGKTFKGRKDSPKKHATSDSESSGRSPRYRSSSSPRDDAKKYEKRMNSRNVESVSRKLGEESIEEKMDRYNKAARESVSRSHDDSNAESSPEKAVDAAKYRKSRSPSAHKSSSPRKYDRDSESKKAYQKYEDTRRERSCSSREDRKYDRLRRSAERKSHRYRHSRSRSRSPIRHHRERPREAYRHRRSRSRGRYYDRSPRRRRSSSRNYRRRSRSRDYRRRSRSRSYDRHSRSHLRGSSSRDRYRRRHHSRSSSQSKSRSRPSSRERSKVKNQEPNSETKVGSLPLSTTASAMTPQMALQQTMAAMSAKAQALTGVELPKYYNPAAVNPLKYAEQVQKRKLLWQTKEKAEEQQQKNTVWDKLTFAQDQDGKMTAKFRKLMGIKGENKEECEPPTSEKEPDDDAALQKQEELFKQLGQQYEVARMSTHTHRGVGLGYSTQVMFPPLQRPT